MIDSRTERSFRFALYGVAALATAAYVGFIYAYPKVFPYIQQADPQNYRRNVDAALAAGNTEQAIDIARFATTWFSLDPDVYALHGELLLAAGRTQEAKAQFERALALTTTPAPESRLTRLPYFHARARLGMGKIAWQQGDTVAAVREFEFAHAFADLSNPDFEEYHDALYAAYAALGAWSRALEFRTPGAEELAKLDREGLVAVIAAAEGARQWELLAQTGRALLSKDTGDPVGQYAVGRALVAQRKYEDAIQPLSSATDYGYLDAPYFLGLALERNHDNNAAIAAYRTAEPDSLYGPFALARALQLQPGTANDDARQLRDAALAAFERACPVKLAPTPKLLGITPWEPVAIGFSAPPVSGGAVPVVVRWDDRSTQALAASEFNVEDSDEYLLVRHGGSILQLQWAANRLPVSDFEHFDIGLRNPPGWLDPDATWNDVREVPVGEIVSDSGRPGRVLRVTGDSPDARAVVYSMPITVRPAALCVLAARIGVSDGRVVFGWEFFGRREERVDAGNVVNQQSVRESGWRAAVTQIQYPWQYARAILGVYGDGATEDFDNVMFLELVTPPKPSK